MADATEAVVALTPAPTKKESTVAKVEKKPAAKKAKAAKPAAKTAKKPTAKKAAKVAKKEKTGSGGHKAQTQVDAKAWKLLVAKQKAEGYDSPADFVRSVLYTRLKYKPED